MRNIFGDVVNTTKFYHQLARIYAVNFPISFLKHRCFTIIEVQYDVVKTQLRVIASQNPDLSNIAIAEAYLQNVPEELLSVLPRRKKLLKQGCKRKTKTLRYSRH